MKMTVVYCREQVKMNLLTPSNLVTIGRLFISIGVVMSIGLFFIGNGVGPSPWVWMMIFILLLISDGIDGWLARRLNNATNMGARLDQTADIMFNLALCMAVWWMTPVGLWVFMIMAVKLIYEVARLMFRPLQFTIPAYFPIGKAIHVVSSTFLIAVLWPWGPTIQITLSVLAVTMVIVSFGVYAGWQIIRYDPADPDQQKNRRN